MTGGTLFVDVNREQITLTLAADTPLNNPNKTVDIVLQTIVALLTSDVQLKVVVNYDVSAAPLADAIVFGARQYKHVRVVTA